MNQADFFNLSPEAKAKLAAYGAAQDAGILRRQHEVEEVITHPGGASSTKKPRFGLVPYVAFTEMAARFELGEAKYKGKGCWNALSENRESALTKEWVTARLEHVINHALTAIEKIHGRLPDDGDSDAGGILFGGAALAEYLRLHKL